MRTNEASEGRGPGAVQEIVRRWFPGCPAVRPLGSGGFSGSPVWLVETAEGPFVLKAFAAAVARPRAAEVHRQMERARAAGVLEVPAVQRMAGGDTLAAAEGRLWEMIGFIDGAAIDEPQCEQMAAALSVLARLHAAFQAADDGHPSPAVDSRIVAARRMLARPWATRCVEVGSAEAGPGSLRWEVGQRLMAACAAVPRPDRFLHRIASLAPVVLSRQWVLRDIWSEHVLFSGDDVQRVAGIIDHHAAGLDTPATDLARLLGSWIEPEAVVSTWWTDRLAAYEAIRPLAGSVRRPVPFLAASGVIFGLDNWFRWTLEEGRQFGSISQVCKRIDRLVAALPAAREILEDWAQSRV